jgi:hypothetical protein
MKRFARSRQEVTVSLRRRILETVLVGYILLVTFGGADAIQALGDAEQSSPNQIICRVDLPAKEKQTPVSSQRSKNLKAPRFGTFIAKLDHAPYPYAGKVADTEHDFFDTVDPTSGERFHTNRYGVRLAEKTHYLDNSVLFHIPIHFDPRKPLTYVVFFHALQTNISKSNQDYALAKQLEKSGLNAILVMPQLARNAADTSPGKFFQRNVFGMFMTEVAEVLANRLGKSCHNALAEAPIVIAAFSGGFKAAAYVLDRGGLDERIIGALLLDALYEDVDKFDHWIRANLDHAFFVSIYGQGECEKNSRALAMQLNRLELLEHPIWPGRVAKGQILLVHSPHKHNDIPLLGPPAEPLRTVLRGIHRK